MRFENQTLVNLTLVTARYDGIIRLRIYYENKESEKV